MSSITDSDHSGRKRRRGRTTTSSDKLLSGYRQKRRQPDSDDQALFGAKDVSNAARMWRGGIGTIFQWAFNFLHSTSVLSLPLFGLICLASLDFLNLIYLADAMDNLVYDRQPVTLEDPRRDGAEAIKKYFLALIYLLTIFLSIIHIKEVYHYFRNNLYLVLMPLILIPGVLYSINPTKVVTNTVLIIISLLIATLFFCVTTRKDRLKNFYYTIFLAIFLVHLASLVLLVFLPVDFGEFFYDEKRYGGFAGNPNTLGSTGVLGIWAAVCLIYGKVAEKKVRRFALIGMVVFGITVKLSGSGTSLVTILLIFALMLWMRLLALVSHRTRVLTSVGLVCAMVLISMGVLVVYSPYELLTLFADSLGKDTTLTGRTELWKIASAAISERPIFGWSFDSHESVKANPSYTIDYNHYHNGFLDVLVLGGVVLFVYLIFNFSNFVYHFQKAFKMKASYFPLIIPLVILFIQNMGEYSLMRPLSPIWQVYITTYVLLTYIEYRPKRKITMTWRSEYAELVRSLSKPSRKKRTTRAS